jgi:glutathionylspermidine synthase
MRREPGTPRPDWRRKCEEVGFHFHSMDGTYWDESACYAFSADEIDELEAATGRLHRMCLEACDFIVDRRRLDSLAIPAAFQAHVAESWRNQEPSLYGRFDLRFDGRAPPKLLEYNADTPTAALEASVVQWRWLQEVKPGADQFNSIHEKLIARWEAVRRTLPPQATLHFACVRDSDEDLGTIEYLRDTAIQAGLPTAQLFVGDIGWDREAKTFVDLEERPIEAIFKLYPWEWLAREAFGPHLLLRTCRWIEPPWKMMLSNKALLAILWELYPGHENLLPAYLEPGKIEGDYVRKPLLSREGANIAVRRPAGAMLTPGTYGAEGYVYQGYAELPSFDGNYAVIGSWLVGGEPAGIGIREDTGPITLNTSRFVPHYFS